MFLYNLCFFTPAISFIMYDAFMSYYGLISIYIVKPETALATDSLAYEGRIAGLHNVFFVQHVFLLLLFDHDLLLEFFQSEALVRVRSERDQLDSSESTHS